MSETTVLTALAAVITAFGGLGVGKGLLELYQARQATRKGDRESKDAGTKAGRADAIGEWQSISAYSLGQVAVMQARLDGVEQNFAARLAAAEQSFTAKLDAAETREQECLVKFERVWSHLRYMTGFCQKAGMDPMPYDPDGSHVHLILPK